jgi:hypothetical protein
MQCKLGAKEKGTLDGRICKGLEEHMSLGQMRFSSYTHKTLPRHVKNPQEIFNRIRGRILILVRTIRKRVKA